MLRRKKVVRKKQLAKEPFMPRKRDILVRKIFVRAFSSLPEEHMTEIINDMLDGYENEMAEYLAVELARDKLVIYKGKPGARTLQQWVFRRLKDWGIKNNG